MLQHRKLKSDCDFPDCSFSCQSLHDLHIHKNNMHYSIWPFNCQWCGEGFEKSEFLKQHSKSHNTVGPIKCIRKKQTSGAILKKLMESVENEKAKITKLEECHLCGQVIRNSKSHFQAHVLKHETEIPGVLKCIYRSCKLTFTSASVLKKHAVQHLDFSLSHERPFACDFPRCNFASKSKHQLGVHKRRVHSSESWACQICDKRFKNKLYRSHHIRKVHKKRLE